jgi:hypothetical protein
MSDKLLMYTVSAVSMIGMSEPPAPPCCCIARIICAMRGSMVSKIEPCTKIIDRDRGPPAVPQPSEVNIRKEREKKKFFREGWRVSS